jgi:hypothetical protein
MPESLENTGYFESGISFPLAKQIPALTAFV